MFPEVISRWLSLQVSCKLYFWSREIFPIFSYFPPPGPLLYQIHSSHTSYNEVLVFYSVCECFTRPLSFSLSLKTLSLPLTVPADLDKDAVQCPLMTRKISINLLVLTASRHVVIHIYWMNNKHRQYKA